MITADRGRLEKWREGFIFCHPQCDLLLGLWSPLSGSSARQVLAAQSQSVLTVFSCAGSSQSVSLPTSSVHEYSCLPPSCCNLCVFACACVLYNVHVWCVCACVRMCVCLRVCLPCVCACVRVCVHAVL